MAQWTSVCTHSHTDYGYSSSLKLVNYATSGKAQRPCVHVAMVPKRAIGTPNVTKLRELAKAHPTALEIVVYDTASEESMADAVRDISDKTGESGVNLVYGFPDYCEEARNATLEDVTEEILRETFHQNCAVPVFLSKLFYPALKKAAAANATQPLNRRRAALIHIMSERGVLGDHFEGTRGTMYAYSASLSAMIMSMKTMSYEFNKRNDGILTLGVIAPSPHLSHDYDVTLTRDKISEVVHKATGDDHGKCLDTTGRDVSY